MRSPELLSAGEFGIIRYQDSCVDKVRMMNKADALLLLYNFSVMLGGVALWGLFLRTVYRCFRKRRAAACAENKKAEEERHQEQHRQRGIHKKFKTEFENRKQTIGQIVCPQCQWTGEQGDGMSYQEFFAYELHIKHKVKIDETLIRDADNLSDESQYKCPVWKRTNWQKV